MTEELAEEQVSAPALTFEKFGFDKAIMKSIKIVKKFNSPIFRINNKWFFYSIHVVVS